MSELLGREGGEFSAVSELLSALRFKKAKQIKMRYTGERAESFQAKRANIKFPMMNKVCVALES